MSRATAAPSAICLTTCHPGHPALACFGRVDALDQSRRYPAQRQLSVHKCILDAPVTLSFAHWSHSKPPQNYLERRSMLDEEGMTTHDEPLQGQHTPVVSESKAPAPFIIEHRQEDSTGSTFRPSARLILTERIRTSGLWRTLTPEDFANLLLILSFVTPHGWCRPTFGTGRCNGRVLSQRKKPPWTGLCRCAGRSSR